MTSEHPTFGESVRVFARIGLLSFGGPAGQIALMHDELVDKHRWIEEPQFLHALNFCHLLPGPEAQQLATYIGWRLHGLRGGLMAGTLFLLPGVAIIMALSMLYVAAAGLDWFAALFLGIKAAVLAVVVQALIRIAGRALDTAFKRALAAIAFVALALFDLPFPLVVLSAGLAGWLAATWRPGWLALKAGGPGADAPPRPSIPATLRTIAAWGAIWALPLLLIWVTLGDDHALMQIGLFFSQLAVVTFGGAYAVLAYMAQQAVQGFGWLNAGEMADGLGLAETTPGPLILVTQFVGFLAAYRDAAPFTPLVAGGLGALMTIWVTFAPCFLWIFTFAPWIDRLQHARRLKGALATITASVVGVIANLSLWFALHVIFTRVEERELGPLRFDWPDAGSIDGLALALAAWAAVHLLVLKRSVVEVLGVAAVLGLAVRPFI
ncbi:MULTISPECIES: chromate efflux transporter [Sphingomonadales]|jgi:chromate transporter|uniref:chromate efflux transporter n=2 Tax=Alphaproteobacteria TaxID=28211 RepID=UPI00076AE055|nr:MULTISPECIES: chromate efflux transporter [Sphingomonadales]MAF63495.1 chromate transporter [Blastomonas sp.]MBA4781452.1 chromate efflux transporter [Blastomonas sp.]|tara:strand:+ start:54183 stop:55493 length:1311 start_codon:yes stop_codon:yes gene_type:complete